MKRKNIIKMIKNDSNNVVVPNVKQKILDNIATYDEVSDKHPSKSNKLLFSFRLASIFVTVLILVVGISIVIKNGSQTTTPKNDVSKSHQAYAMQAVTLFNFATNYNSNIMNTSKTRKAKHQNLVMISNGYSTTEYQQIAKEINNYFLSAADLLNKEKIEYHEVEINDSIYDRGLNITINLLGEDSEYTIYFNEFPINANDRDKDFDEISSRIEGIIMMDNKSFPIEGKKEIENDEYEVELKMYLSENKDEYFEVSQEIENQENEYSYSHYQGQQLIEEFEISIEEENNQKIVELEVIKDSQNYEFEFICYNQYVFCEFKFLNYEGEVKVYSDASYYLYQFTNDTEIKINKNN